ncbi:MAG TPA: hypothetical protein VHY10_10080 [Xanthobacteraceae bacterium]|jgi:hypothetical protein|nr:hypothetical protein [Xanthobacteraceae bacterium]
MSAVVRAFSASRSRTRPWQNHELAEFYRVIDILGRAGLGVVPDMGISDEGEPWFAFCRADTGEVVVHCARIDGSFVATSTSFSEVFYGNELRDVVNSILKSKHFASVTPIADKRLYLHPAAVFTAFIAAALLFSQHAHAGDGHAGPADGQSTDGAAFLKFLAAIKTALADGSATSAISTGAGAEPLYFAEPNGFDAPISLGALLSATLAVLPLIDPLDTQGALPGVDKGPAHFDVPLSFVLPTFLSLSTLTELNHDTTVQPPDDSSVIATNGILPNFHGLDLTSLAGQSPPLAPTDTSQTANSPPAFLASLDGSGDLHFSYIQAPSLHAGTFAVMDQTVATVQQTLTPAGHVFDINEITSTALAIFFGLSLPSQDVGTPAPPLPTESHILSDIADSITKTNPDIISTAGLTTTTPDNTDTITATLPTIITTSTPTDNTPTDSVSDSSPTTAVTTPSVIVMGANPTLGLEQLTDYALGNHAIHATLVESALLAATLTSYTAGGAALPVLVVFDSTTVKQSMFEFSTTGIYFVNDHQLGIGPAQAAPADLVTVDLATGGTMTLLGVVQPIHAIF